MWLVFGFFLAAGALILVAMDLASRGREDAARYLNWIINGVLCSGLAILMVVVWTAIAAGWDELETPYRPNRSGFLGFTGRGAGTGYFSQQNFEG